MDRKIFSPLKIGGIEIKNRFMMTAVNLSYADADGKTTDRLIEFYRARARGGVGLIIVGTVGIDPDRINRMGVMQLSRDSDIEGISRLVEAIHAEGAKCFPQIWHPGAYAKPEEFDGKLPIAPSEYICRFNRAQTVAMSIEQIEQQVRYFADAAGRAKTAGFDGAELVGSAGYLISQFLSQATNKRTDRYGGDLDGRMTFLREVVQAVRARIGEEMPLTVRLAGNEFITGGNSNDDCVYIAMELEKMGVNGLSITGGWHETLVPQVTMDVPRGAYSYLARRVKKAVGIPVAACNRMNYETAYRIVDRGDADFIGFCRAFIADAEFVNKAKMGRPDLIRPCIGCNQGCMDMVFKSKPLACLSNAGAGREAGHSATSEAKRTLVVGAGVAGMEYALRASESGARVTVWEAEKDAGGQMDVVSAPPDRGGFAELPKFLYTACQNAGIDFVFGKQATADEIIKAVENGEFDKVVIATGSKPIMPVIPYEEGANIVSSWDVLRNKAATGNDVVIVGGGAVAVETALLLAMEGTIDAETLRFLFLYRAENPERLYELLTHGSKKVSIVEMLPKIGMDIGPSTRWIMLGNLSRYGVIQHVESKVIELKRDGVVVEKPGGKKEIISADTIVLAVGSRSENTLALELEERIPNLLVVGDAVKPATALDAIKNAFENAFESV